AIHIKHVLPWTSPHGARFYFAETYVTLGKNRECFMQSSRDILQSERNGGFISLRKNLFCSADQEKSSEVFFVIFDSGCQDSSTINSSRVPPCNASGISQPAPNNVFYTSRRIVKRCRLNLRIALKKITALFQSNGMRICLPYLRNLHS